MSKRKLPQRGTEEYNRLVMRAALAVCHDCENLYSLFLLVHDYLIDRELGPGGASYGPEDECGSDYDYALRWDDFAEDVLTYLIEKPLTRWRS
jgi:hypothetical protein